MEEQRDVDHALALANRNERLRDRWMLTAHQPLLVPRRLTWIQRWSLVA